MKWVLDMLNCKNVLCEKISESIFQMMDTIDTMCIYIMLQNVNSTEETRSPFGNVVNSLQYAYITYPI